ncbi:Glutathione-specific gamma-glutamylcyclotransferase [Sparassis crispa]|uniref:glutathione-specific gamma-glutamylcyclotransferase n=1 Tax=Sparassis crispa TaxID=139825 RepID=A0A401GB17_9APHY|nr:Glutathione-specific gamma-glutamylcyclotransferase [Sparassis crispa]GBE79333.1 Glutathione-specific gamma-glutamylcyclotransferase [Sparassis crispa]
MSEAPYVVFGYGSLIFKPPPHVIAQVPGFLKGYVRRFAQKSHDHRGTPENPGRAVTLVHVEDWEAFSGSDPFPHDDVVWGIAYTIDPLYASEVREYLDYREKDGYTLEQLDVHGLENGVERVVIHKAYCYVGRNDNPSFIGSEQIDALAERIWRSVGPSGRNKDYLYELVAAVRRLAPESYDSHLFALEVCFRSAHGVRFESRLTASVFTVALSRDG